MPSNATHEKNLIMMRVIITIVADTIILLTGTVTYGTLITC